MNAQVWMLIKKTFNSGSLMPGSIIRPNIYNRSLETGYNLGEHLQEPISISTYPFHNSVETI